MFGSLIKGLRIGMDLLLLLQKEEHILLSISKFLKLPLLSGSDGLNEFLTQLEAAVDSDFPKYQVNFWEELEPSCFSKCFCLNPVERYCITDTLHNLFPLTEPGFLFTFVHIILIFIISLDGNYSFTVSYGSRRNGKLIPITSYF